MSIAFLFPGQGAQHVGMGRDFYDASPAARELFDVAERISGIQLKQLCFEGPEEDLARTDIAQPAIFTVSAAALAVMREKLGAGMPRPQWMAGLSLGEYTALWAAGAGDFPQMVRLVTRRGELMQQAAVAVPSGMLSVMGVDEAQAAGLAQAAAGSQVLTCANFNCPGQVVLSGELEALERAAALAEQHGASGAIPLKVAGAFHSTLMAPAAAELARELEQVEFRQPEVAVLSNVDAAATSADEIRGKLLEQLVSAVLWNRCMDRLLSEGVEKFYEIGPGRVLAGLMRRIARRADMTSVNSLEAVEKLASQA